jgi:hypothetical protein
MADSEAPRKAGGEGEFWPLGHNLDGMTSVSERTCIGFHFLHGRYLPRDLSTYIVVIRYL